MNIATVAFVYNHPCPLKCDFCCHPAEVVGPGRLSPSNVIPIIREFSRQHSVTRFAFTGGDPFLYVREIVEIMRVAREFGADQPFHMVTSGFWARTDDETNKKLSPLASLGMDILYVSYDKQHARWVPPDYVKRIVSACKAYNVKPSIYGVFWDQSDRVEDLLPDIQDVEMHSDLVVSIGRARSKYTDGPRYNLPNTAKYTCSRPRDYDLVIYPDGEVYPCCSGGFNKEGKLSCGNAFKDPAATLLTNVYSHFHARIAKEIGFDKFYEKVKLARPDLYPLLTRFDKVDSVCEICRDIHRSEALRESLKDVYQDMEIDYALSCVDEHDKAFRLFS